MSKNSFNKKLPINLNFLSFNSSLFSRIDVQIAENFFTERTTMSAFEIYSGNYIKSKQDYVLTIYSLNNLYTCHNHKRSFTFF